MEKCISNLVEEQKVSSITTESKSAKEQSNDEKKDDALNLDIEQIVEYMKKPDSNFKWAERIDFAAFSDDIAKKVLIEEGIPLILSNSTQNWKVWINYRCYTH
jgi:hypothetical protein